MEEGTNKKTVKRRRGNKANQDEKCRSQRALLYWRFAPCTLSFVVSNAGGVRAPGHGPGHRQIGMGEEFLSGSERATPTEAISGRFGTQRREYVSGEWFD
eukprot:1626214-Pyramimonas_sp.AAC.1